MEIVECLQISVLKFKQCFCYQFLGNITAVKTIWMVRDAFLKDIMPTLFAMKNEAIQLNIRQPYLYEYYNVETFTYNGSSMNSVLASINNAILYALNHDQRLLRYILMMLDTDLIKVAVQEHNDCGLKRMLDEFSHWLHKNINSNIETRKNDIQGKKPGAIATSAESRIVWVTALHRPIHHP